ncbi:hypothetical protein Vadar_002624 [Vaccinium darrowii]|uniref:Uncharacterized protein n=1 Tax=Vaccinium darrowii TaxID=229202 RepID=A0ACB7WX92_9ERIC|nr:hypothetical protein Vadar_002624 [Vaccinium darrowii]
MMTWSTWAPSSESSRNSSKPKTSMVVQQNRPFARRPDQILAIIDILIVSQKRINNHLDYYALLQINYNNNHMNLELIKKHYCYLAFLLNPDKNSTSLRSSLTPTRIALAFCFVASDLVKNLSFDNKLNFYSKGFTAGDFNTTGMKS